MDIIKALGTSVTEPILEVSTSDYHNNNINVYRTLKYSAICIYVLDNTIGAATGAAYFVGRKLIFKR